MASSNYGKYVFVGERANEKQLLWSWPKSRALWVFKSWDRTTLVYLGVPTNVGVICIDPNLLYLVAAQLPLWHLHAKVSLGCKHGRQLFRYQF